MQYVDTGALLKRYVLDPDSDTAERLLQADPEWVTAAHTEVEVRRNLARRLGTRPALLHQARSAFAEDWASAYVVALDAQCSIAADLTEATGARTPDALHLAAARRAGAPSTRLVASTHFPAHRRARRPLARSMGRSTAARTADSLPITRTNDVARVTAV